MRSTNHVADAGQLLQASLEILANLIYLARHTETHSTKQHQYLDLAAQLIEQLAGHPQLSEMQDC